LTIGRRTKKFVVYFVVISIGYLFYCITIKPYAVSVYSDTVLSYLQTKLEKDGEIRLSDVTPYEWDEICLFHRKDSEPYTAYDAYQNKIQSDPNALYWRKDYSNILVFLNHGSIIQQYASQYELFRVDGVWPSWKYQSDHLKETVLCIKGDVVFRYERHPLNKLFTYINIIEEVS